MKKNYFSYLLLFFAICTFNINAQINVFPHQQDFESFSTCGGTCTANCILQDGWTNGPLATRDFSVDNGGTTSSGTGPSIDHTPGTSSGIYLYAETTSPCSGTESWHLITPIIELSGTNNLQFTFWYHMFGSAMGQAHLDISTDTGATWVNDIIPTWTDNVDLWQEQKVSLSAYSGQNVQVRIRYENPTSFTGDFAVDNFYLFDLQPNDAGVSEVMPLAPCAGANTIDAVIKNFGTNQIDSLIINWSINGVIQTPINYNTLLDTTAGVGPNCDTVALGVHTFTSGVIDSILVWTSMPNGVVDSANGNDTLQYYKQPALGGIYTIGGATPDYPDFTSAINDITLYGICGPVVFNVRDGVYTEQISLGSIIGSSAVNSIIFQPDAANVGPVEITYALSNSTDNYVVEFSDASYITFDSINMTNTNLSYGRVISFSSSNDYISIKNGVLTGSTSTSTSFNNAVIFNETGASNLSSNISIDNNQILNGSYSLYWYGGSTVVRENNFSLTNNDISGNSYYNLALYYQDNMNVYNNKTFQSPSATSVGYGIYAYYCDSGSIQNNEVHLYGSSTNYGLYLGYCDGSATNPFVVANNMLTTSATSTGTSYGMYINYCKYANVYHNSINVQGTSPTNGRALYINGSTSTLYGDINIVNNIFANTGGGLAAEISSGANSGYVSRGDYNVYYTTGSVPFEIAGAPTANLATWTTGTSLDTNSYIGDPLFNSAYDLHVSSVVANDVGDNAIGITVDIDNDPRPLGGSTIVDIGADEFDPPFCPRPGGVTIYDIGPDTLFLSWIGGPNDSVYEIEYGLNGFTPGTGTLLTVTSSPYQVTGLSPETHYDFYLRTRCITNDSSSWVGPYSDTTLELCKKTPFFTVLGSDVNYINVGWNFDSAHVSYIVEYGLQGYTQGTGTVLTTTSNFIQVTGLQPATGYDFYVKSVCATGDTSVWDGAYYGKTKCSKYNTLPFRNNFDSLERPPFARSCQTTEYMVECFYNATGNQAFWQPWSGNTGSGGTGPFADNTSGSSTGIYVYLEGSGCYGSLDTLVTPYFDLSVPDPALDIAYHMYGSSMGNLRIVAVTESGNKYTQFVMIGDQGNQWHDTTLSLTNIKDSTVKFWIIGAIGTSSSSDIAIDDWKIYDRSPASINELVVNSMLNIFPNPNNGDFSILNKGDVKLKGELMVLDASGRSILNENISLRTQGRHDISLNNVGKGIYFVRFDSGYGIITRRIIVQ